MVTFTASLSFPDGQTVIGKVSASDAGDESPVVYQGAVERLPRRFEIASPPLLKILFRNIATETGARFCGHVRGTYDSQPCCLK